jgi:hypothetical protein
LRRPEHLTYGGGRAIDSAARYAAAATGLRLCAGWADEALSAASALHPGLG